LTIALLFHRSISLVWGVPALFVTRRFRLNSK